MLFDGKFTKGTANKKIGFFRNHTVENITQENMTIYHIGNNKDMEVYVVDKLILVKGKKARITKSARQMYTAAFIESKQIIVVDSKFLHLTTKEQIALYHYAVIDIASVDGYEIAEKLHMSVYNYGSCINADFTESMKMIYAATKCGSAKAVINALKATNKLQLKTCKSMLNLYKQKAGDNEKNEIIEELFEDDELFEETDITIEPAAEVVGEPAV